mgnify:CR=1 FL=1
MALDITGLQVIYEDNHLIAVNKPARMLVHGDSSGDTPLVDYVKQYIKMRSCFRHAYAMHSSCVRRTGTGPDGKSLFEIIEVF